MSLLGRLAAYLFSKKSISEKPAAPLRPTTFHSSLARGRESAARSLIGIVYRSADGRKQSRVIGIGAIQPADANASMLIAYCHLREASRHFRTDRVEAFFDPDTGEILQEPALSADPKYLSNTYQSDIPREAAPQTTIDQIARQYRSELEALGWVVETSRNSETGQEQLACFRRNKRTGQRLKHPHTALSFEPKVFDQVAMPDGTIRQVYAGERQRPWSAGTGTAWKDSQKALAAFLQIARRGPLA